MKRYYYISNDLDDLESVEQELEENGIDRPQIHVLSNFDADIAKRDLNEVHSFFRTDVVHWGLRGLMVGVMMALVALGVVNMTGLHETVGWTPFIFLAIILLGFCTWEGGFYGFQEPNERFRKFQHILDKGKHVFFVDVRPEQEDRMNHIIGMHHSMIPAATGEAAPQWLVHGQKRWDDFLHWAP